VRRIGIASSKRFLSVLHEALGNIREPRFFETERGYQGELLVQLAKKLKTAAFPGDPIVEQEYQKTMPLHGIKIRPDIVIHIPFERGHVESRDQGNFVAIELKRRSTENEARSDFANLAQMHEVLRYPLTIFINIDSEKTHSAACPQSIARQTVSFAVRLEDGKPVIRSETCAQLTKNSE
jgi:hypothetical protein